MATATPTRPATIRPTPMPREEPTAGASGRIARWLSTAVAVLLAASSLAGLLVDGLYREVESVVAMLRGYDLAALVAAAPLLAISSLPALRTSLRARLVAAGTLAFVVYDYAYYVFGAGFNDLFLLHVALFSTAMFALGATVLTLDVRGIAHRFRIRSSPRIVGIILGVLAASLAGMWVAGSLGFAINGTVPNDGNALVYPIEITHLGYALDLAFLVPIYALSAVMLWRRRPWGHVIGTVMLVAGAFTQLTYIIALVFQARADIAGATAFDPFAPVILAAYLIGAGMLLADLRREQRESDQGSPTTSAISSAISSIVASLVDRAGF